MATFDWLAIIIGPQQWPLFTYSLMLLYSNSNSSASVFFLLVKFCQKEQFKKLKKKIFDIEVVF